MITWRHNLILAVAAFSALALSACDKKAALSQGGAEAAKALDAPAAPSGIPSHIMTAAEVAAMGTVSPTTGSMSPREIGDALREAQMPAGFEGLNFPNPPKCEDAGPTDRFVQRCGFNVADDKGRSAGLVAIELYDHDLDFDTQTEMLLTMVEGMSNSGVLTKEPTFKFGPPGGVHRSVKVYCAQAISPRGPAFCMTLTPNHRSLVLAMVKAIPGQSDPDIDRAESLNMIAFGLMPERSKTD